MKTLSKSLFALVLLFSGAAAALAQPALYIEGTHYETIDEPVRTVDPNKIEVTEVFWYGCPHCYAFEPLLDSWVAKLPSDVVFVRSPGMWDELMKTHAQIFYTAMELKVFDKIHGVAFDAIHQKRNYLQTPEAIREMFVAQGVAAADFDKAWASFQVNSAVRQADTRMRAYGVRGVPNLIVNGKYRITTGEGVPTQADMLKVAEYLIEKERSS
ncbi:MAG TPA: thiol:disulfide interchange protein DsbA/DsbL [Pseudomonadales bacterium]